MPKLSTAVVAGLAAAAAITTVGAAHADAKTYHRHQIQLTRSQTAFVAHNNIGNALSAIPSVPNLIYNPGFGRVIQHAARDAAARPGCLVVGIGTPVNGTGYNIDYAESLPARRCAP